MRKEITARSVAALEARKIIDPKTSKPVKSITDEHIAGFVAERLPSGRVRFGYRFGPRGNRGWITIGLLGEMSADAARARAEIHVGVRRAGEDPAAKLRAAAVNAANTVNHLLNEYIESSRFKKLRAGAAIAAGFKNHVRPAIGKLVIYKLKRKDIAIMRKKIAAKYPRMAEIVVSHLSEAFNWWAINDEDFNSPIVKGMNPREGEARARVLADDELADLWRALDEVDNISDAFKALVRVLLLTACRRGDVAGMHTRELERGSKRVAAVGGTSTKDATLWTIPAARYKTERDHMLPLIEAIKKYLPERKNGFVFSCDGGKTPIKGFHTPLLEVKAKIAEIRRKENRGPMAPWSLHDLRRTARTIMAAMKVARDDAERVLGHRFGAVEETYDRFKYLDEKADALTKLAGHVNGIVSPTPAAPRSRLRIVAG